MENDSEARYFYFPVQMLGELADNLYDTCNNIIHFGIYNYSLTLEEGNELDKYLSSAKYLNVMLGDPNSPITYQKKLFKRYPENSPKTNLRTTLVFNYRDEFKSEFEIITLIAYAAIKSIIGTKPYIRTTNDFWIARMAGCATVKEKAKEDYPELIIRHTTRRRFNRIKEELQLSWGVNIYTKRTMRGIYVSMNSRFSLEQLIREAETKSREYKLKQLQKKQEEIRQKVLTEFKNNKT